MKYLISALFIFVMSGCDWLRDRFASKPIESNPVTQNQNLETQGPRDCNLADIQNKQALAKWKMENGVELLVCELDYSIELSENKLSGWIALFKKTNGELHPILPNIESKPSDVYGFTIEKLNGREVKISRGIQVGTADENRGLDQAISEIKVECAKNDCTPSKETCVSVPAHKADTSIAQVEGIVAGRINPEDVYDYETVMGDVIRAGAMKNPRAIKLILDTPSEKLHVDGAVAESYLDGKQLLEHLRSLKCL